MKTLASCTPAEFLRQVNRLRHRAHALLGEAGVLEIRGRRPPLTGRETGEERRRIVREHTRQAASDLLDALLESHADATVELLGMLCFLPPDEARAAPPLDLLAAAVELLQSQAVVDFLSLWARPAPSNTAAG